MANGIMPQFPGVAPMQIPIQEQLSAPGLRDFPIFGDLSEALGINLRLPPGQLLETLEAGREFGQQKTRELEEFLGPAMGFFGAGQTLPIRAASIVRRGLAGAKGLPRTVHTPDINLFKTGGVREFPAGRIEITDEAGGAFKVVGLGDVIQKGGARFPVALAKLRFPEPIKNLEGELRGAMADLKKALGHGPEQPFAVQSLMEWHPIAREAAYLRLIPSLLGEKGSRFFPKIYGTMLDDAGNPVMVMERLKGTPLSTLEAIESPALFNQLRDISEEMGRRGIALVDRHLDNMMLTIDKAGKPQIKFLDLGIIGITPKLKAPLHERKIGALQMARLATDLQLIPEGVSSVMFPPTPTIPGGEKGFKWFVNPADNVRFLDSLKEALKAGADERETARQLSLRFRTPFTTEAPPAKVKKARK